MALSVAFEIYVGTRGLHVCAHRQQHVSDLAELVVRERRNCHNELGLADIARGICGDRIDPGLKAAKQHVGLESLLNHLEGIQSLRSRNLATGFAMRNRTSEECARGVSTFCQHAK